MVKPPRTEPAAQLGKRLGKNMQGFLKELSVLLGRDPIRGTIKGGALSKRTKASLAATSDAHLHPFNFTHIMNTPPTPPKQVIGIRTRRAEVGVNGNPERSFPTLMASELG